MTEKPMTRREIIRVLGKSAISALPAAALAAGQAQSGKRPAFGPLLQVALVHCPNYEPERLLEAIRAGWR